MILITQLALIYNNIYPCTVVVTKGNRFNQVLTLSDGAVLVGTMAMWTRVREKVWCDPGGNKSRCCLIQVDFNLVHRCFF